MTSPTVAILSAGVSGLALVVVAIINVLGIRLNSRQHGASMEKIDDLTEGFRDLKGDVRDLKDDVRDAHTKLDRHGLTHLQRHQENVERLDKIDSDVKKLTGRVARIEKEIPYGTDRPETRRVT